MCKFSNIKSQDSKSKNETSANRAAHEILLMNLAAQHKDISKGYFGPESMTWKLYREPTIVLGSMRALLLQIAHPSIAKGVVMYSNFEKDTIGRAHRTFLSMVRIWFGDIPTANKSARRLYNIHSMIRGQMVWETEDETIVNPFCANDPDLLYWVLATLIDTTIILFEKTVRTLSKKEKEQFYEESKITAQLMGIPLSKYPRDLSLFYIRYNEILNNGTLQLREEGKKITTALFKAPYPIRRINEILAEGFFPESVKKLFGFKSGNWILKFILFFAKTSTQLMPNDLRYPPHYHQAKYRLALSNHKKPRFIEKVHFWISTHINWYFISNKLVPNKSRICPF